MVIVYKYIVISLYSCIKIWWRKSSISYLIIPVSNTNCLTWRFGWVTHVNFFNFDWNHRNSFRWKCDISNLFCHHWQSNICILLTFSVIKPVTSVRLCLYWDTHTLASNRPCIISSVYKWYWRYKFNLMSTLRNNYLFIR